MSKRRHRCYCGVLAEHSHLSYCAFCGTTITEGKDNQGSGSTWPNGQMIELCTICDDSPWGKALQREWYHMIDCQCVHE